MGRGSAQMLDVAMRAQRGDHDCHQDQRRSDQAIELIGIAVELAVGDDRCDKGREDQGEIRHRHDAADHPSKEQPPAEQRAAFIIATRQFRPERGTWDFIETDADADQRGQPQKIPEQRRLRPAGWRIPDQEIGGGRGQRRSIEEGVPPPPARAQIIRPITDNRIGNRIDHQRDGDGQADQPRIHPDHLTVEQQQEIAEAAILHAIGAGAKAIGDARPQARLVGMLRCSCCHADRPLGVADHAPALATLC